jgi:CHAT domain-containing protein
MVERTQQQKLIRSYLLGELADQERQAVEERMMTDTDFFNHSLLEEDDLIDDYVQGELSAQERKRFEATILATPQGRQQVAFCEQLRGYAADLDPKKVVRASNVVPMALWWAKPLRSPYLRMAASLVILFGLTFAVWRVWVYQSPTDKALAILQQAYQDERSLEARISGFPYAPFLVERGATDSRIDDGKKSRAAYLLQTEVAEHPESAEAHQGLGRYYLAARELDKAIDEFNKAVALQPNQAEMQSDLGAAFLEKGKALKADPGASGMQFAKSLEHLEKALQLRSALSVARFNRALVFEEMQFDDKAAEDWREYLRQDANSPWADEARERLKKIEDRKQQGVKSDEEIFGDFLAAYERRDAEQAWRIVIQNSDLRGGKVENRLLNKYLHKSAGGQADRAQYFFQMLSYVGELARQKIKDAFLIDTIRFYKAASADQKSVLAQAHEFIQSGRANLYKAKVKEATEAYQTAKKIFHESGDRSGELLTDYQLAHTYALQPEPVLALSIFEEIAKTSQQNHYQWLESQALAGMALAHMALLDYSAAMSESTRSLQISEVIGNTNGQLKALNQLGLEYLALHNYQEAIGFQLRCLELLKLYPSEALQSYRIYWSMAQPLNKAGLVTAAIIYQKAAINIATEINSPLLIWRSYHPLGLMYANQGNFEAGLQNIKLAYEQGKSLPDENARRDACGQSLLQLGNLYRLKKDFPTAIEKYDEAIELFSELHYGAFDYAAHKGKLLCCSDSFVCKNYDQELDTTLSLFEQHRAKILEESSKNIFFDAEQNIYDVAIDFAYAKQNIARAFELSEKSKARSLLDLANADTRLLASAGTPDMQIEATSAVMGLAEIQEKLPEQAQIVQYALLSDKLVIWVISKGEIHPASYKISSEELNEKIFAYLEAIKKASDGNAGELLKASEFLYSVLIQPVEPWLDKTRQICIVPDKALNFIPFPSLFSAAANRYLLEEYKLLFAPSANMFILSTTSAREKENLKDERLLSVGNPTFDKRLYPLEDLPDAVHEAEEIKSYYNAASLCLTREAATKRAVESELEKSDVAHLALHAITHEQLPMLSKFLLAQNASQKDDTGVLSSGEIYKLNLTRLKLVVLSACQTAVEKYYGGEGMIGLSRPFIARKVPMVVASLWSVDSNSTSELMQAFHRYRRKSGLPTVEALRQAQLEMLHSDTRRFHMPYYWAPFVVIGGYAEF